MNGPAGNAVTVMEVVATAPPLDVYDKELLARATAAGPVEHT
jgi:hypothetical protein